MKHMNKTPLLALALICFFASLVFAGYEYKPKKDHLGGDITPGEAFKMVKKDPKHTFIVDVRTRFEYQVIGHPQGAYNIPFKFFTTKAGEKGYSKAKNPNFGKDLLARFNPNTDTLILLCRSAKRSCDAVNEAVKAGFAETRVFNMMGGFEGDKNKNKDSSYYGQRWAGGWRLEGLPWTYKMAKDLMYQPDVKS